MNQQQIREWLRNALAAGGPLSLLVMKDFAIDAGTYSLYVNVVLMFAPGLIALAWAYLDNRNSRQIANVQAMPEVAKVVVPDAANGEVGRMARSDDVPKVVTATRNMLDEKAK